MDIKYLTLAAILSFGSFSGCNTNKSNKDVDLTHNRRVHDFRDRNFYEKRVEEISKIEVDLETTLITDSDTLKIEGRGFVVGDYILSLDHVTSRYDRNIPGPFGYLHQKVNRILEKTTIDGMVLEPIVEDSTTDVSIFYLRNNTKLKHKYSNNLSIDDLASSKELYTGMDVFWNGNPFGHPDRYNEGIVSKVQDDGPSPKFKKSFYINQRVIPGTSGTPVWHFDGKRNKIIGVAQFSINHTNFSGIKYMDEYIEKIKEHQNGIKR